MKTRIALFVLSVVFMVCPAVRAGYLKPEEAGFRNCALIYFNDNYTAERFKPIFVKYVDGRPTAQAGYDAALFLLFTVNGKSTLDKATNSRDWLDHIDIWFRHETNVPALDKAVRELGEGGFLKDRIKVMFSIPWADPATNDFGDIDGDGVSEDLGKSADRVKVYNWYIAKVEEEMKRFPRLELWGFYMMNEGIGAKYHELGRDFCSTIHKRGWKALWIPYYNAPGADVAYELGFDAVIMQSNWTFTTRPDGTGSRRNRLVNTAAYTREHHMGLELEINPPEVEHWQDIFARTLETGTRTGFQQAASATYFGSDFYWGTSERPATRKLYALWMDYLAGKPVKLPEAGKWRQTTRSDGATEVVFRFDQARETRQIDLYYRDIPGEFFTAMTTVEGRTDENGPWKPLGWNYRKIVKSSPRSEESLTVDYLPMSARELRIVVRPRQSTTPGKIVEVEPALVSQQVLFSKSFRKPYTTNKEPLVATYPDESGRDLFDGRTGPDWKSYVGWFGPCPAIVDFDFGGEIEFDQVRLSLLDQASAAIALPDTVTAVWSRHTGEQRDSGFGAFPEGYCYDTAFHYDSATGRSTLTLKEPQSARTMRIAFTRRGWLFLSEVEFLLRGKPIPTDRFEYRLSQLDRVSKKDRTRYPDDGVMLTDGYVSSGFGRGSVGKNGGEPLEITVDLQETTRVDKVCCYLCDGQVAGVYMPKTGKLETSLDGKSWSAPIKIEMPKSQKLRAVKVFPVEVKAGVDARFVRVTFSTGAWTFVSEVVVE